MKFFFAKKKKNNPNFECYSPKEVKCQVPNAQETSRELTCMKTKVFEFCCSCSDFFCCNSECCSHWFSKRRKFVEIFNQILTKNKI